MSIDINDLLNSVIQNTRLIEFLVRTAGVAGSAFGARMQFRGILYFIGMQKPQVHNLSNHSVIWFNLLLSVLMAFFLEGLMLPKDVFHWQVWGIELFVYSSIALMVHYFFKKIVLPILEKKYKIKIH